MPPRRVIRSALLETTLTIVCATLACNTLVCNRATAQAILNGDFDSNLDNWQITATPTPAWSADDHAGNDLSGSVTLSNDAVTNNVRLYPMHQCIAVAPGIYTLQAWAHLPAAQPSGRLVVSYAGRAQSDCGDVGVNQVGGFYLDHIGGWQRYAATLTVPSSAAYSLDIRLGIEKDLGGGVLNGNIDAVALLGDALFADGFESN